MTTEGAGPFSTEVAMLHRYISTVAQIGQTKHKFFASFMATTGSPVRSEGEGEQRDLQLDAICNLTTRCH